jgi:hypothetical protein
VAWGDRTSCRGGLRVVRPGDSSTQREAVSDVFRGIRTAGVLQKRGTSQSLAMA